MALEDDIRTLSGVKLFESFTREQIRLLAFGSETLEIPSGREIFREGSEGDCAFIVASGSVALVHDLESARRELGKAVAGEVLGELALIVPSQRLTSAVADGDVRLIRINRTFFRRILDEYPETAALLHRQISRNFQNMVARIEALTGHFRD